MPSEMMFDAWGSRISYAVTEPHAVDRSTFNTQIDDGQIIVFDKNDHSISTMQTISYILLSHGRTAKGARVARAGTAKSSCATSSKDGENCDGDITFRDTGLNEKGSSTHFFDDIVLWKTKLPETIDSFEIVTVERGTLSRTTNNHRESSRITDGSLIGYEAADAICARRGPGARFASYEDVRRSSSIPDTNDAVRLRADIGLTLGGSFNDCDGFTSNSTSNHGIYLLGANIHSEPCITSLKRLLCYHPPQ